MDSSSCGFVVELAVSAASVVPGEVLKGLYVNYGCAEAWITGPPLAATGIYLPDDVRGSPLFTYSPDSAVTDYVLVSSLFTHDDTPHVMARGSYVECFVALVRTIANEFTVAARAKPPRAKGPIVTTVCNHTQILPYCEKESAQGSTV